MVLLLFIVFISYVHRLNNETSSRASELDAKLKTAIEAINDSNKLFLNLAQKGDKIPSSTKDLMLSLSMGISSLQFSSYNAMSQSMRVDDNAMKTPKFTHSDSVPIKHVDSYGIEIEEFQDEELDNFE